MSTPWQKPSGAPTGGPPGGTPAWMKKPQQPQQNQAPQQPQQSQPKVQQAPSQPFKPPGTGAPVSGSGPGWMKNNQAPGGFKPPGQSGPPTGGPPTGNAWMKNKQSPLPSDRNQQQIKRKQEEARLLKQRQQQQRKKKEQEERKRKEKQLEREKKQLQRMKYEDQYSKIRQQQDKLKKTSKNKKSPNKSAKKLQKKSPKKKVKLSTYFEKYLYSISQASSKQEQYEDRIENQKQFISNIFSFSQSVKDGISIYMKQRSIVQRKRNVINLQNIVAEYALVQGISGQPGSAYFRTKNIENLEIKFSYYQVIFSIILKLIRKSTLFRIRAPLMCRATYKGIQFLCQGVSDELLDSVASPAQNFVQILGELTQLQKELKQAGYQFLNRKNFTIKKYNIANSQFYVLYLNENSQNFVLKQVQSTSTTFYPNKPLTFESLTNFSLLASHQIGLTFQSLKKFQQEFGRKSTERMKQSYFSLFQLAHAIRIVYASCQGELEDQTFWSLVFEKNPQIWQMIKKAFEGVYGEVEESNLILKNKFMLAKILQQMVSVRFFVGKQQNKNGQEGKAKKKPIFQSNIIKIIPYPLDSFQIYQISSLFEKIIENPCKVKIAEDSLKLQQIFLQTSQELYLKKLKFFINKQILLLQKGLSTKNNQLIRNAIEEVESYEIQKGKQMQRIIIYPLQIKLYLAALEANIEENEAEQKLKQKAEDENSNQQQHKKSESDRFQKSKFQQSQVREIHSSNQLKLQQKQGKKYKKRRNEDYQTSMLKIFGALLQYIQQLFQDEQQVWIQAGLYLILASYYSKYKVKDKKTHEESQDQDQRYESIQQESQLSYFNNSKNKTIKQRKISKSQTLNNMQKDQLMYQSMAQKQKHNQEQQQKDKLGHPYHKQCMKFIELGHNICLQFYGSYSSNMAQFLLHQADIYYNIKQYNKSESSIVQALKIYRTSSKHTKNVLNSEIILGKSTIERGKIQKNKKVIQKGVQILEKVVDELFSLGMDSQVMQVYDFLCSNLEQRFSSSKETKSPTKNRNQTENHQIFKKHLKIQEYLEKMAEMSFTSKNIQFLKKVVRKVVKGQLALYSKQRSVSLKELHERYMKDYNVEQEDQNQQIMRLQENMIYLQQQKSTFGGLIEVIKWSFGILKLKGQSLQFEKAKQIMEKLLGLFSEKQVLKILGL